MRDARKVVQLRRNEKATKENVWAIEEVQNLKSMAIVYTAR